LSSLVTFACTSNVIQGQTLEQWINDNESLDDELARKVVDAYRALRAVPTGPEHHIIPGGLEWPVTGQISNEDNEAECVVSTRSQVTTMMDERFSVCDRSSCQTPKAKVAFAHGETSPTTEKEKKEVELSPRAYKWQFTY
jgi:hypothetical protein